MSDRLLHRTLLVLTLIGVGIAGYLTYIHYRGFDPICAVGHGCEKVQNSEWAKLAGVPVPLLGLIGYVGILATLLVRGELARLATAGMAIIGFAFSMYLTYREIFTIEAICQWCVGSAVVMTLILIFSVIRVLRVDDDDAYASDLASEPEHEPV
ncbi:vitamin K epoxide reductase family protein [Conexibacter stalactiti]|uniref:Vitamin K epoxide reductase family protein n=1 Tax=Conexibacter stalactiti TaxID=1940611 RepID=A0ABU4HWI7_9ACTN|nr:vitamin K epoxide reductase family protein [Conexibacter stalactiti]MDW5597534.1 vitamin K epoxide reductase family protein [Conexibacter stalactiti]MEC5038176.1 vitamin K epoxide reductase family protein [Conexibacter stalactiti]